MSSARAYWGDLRLWYYGRTYVESMERQGRITHLGVDREEALQVGSNPNFVGEIEVTTMFAPPKVGGSVPYTRQAFRSHVAAMMDALKTRAGLAQPGAVLVWVEDVALARELSSVVTGTYTTTAAHGMSTGDRVLIRNDSTTGGYAYGSITNTGASTFTFSAIETGSAYSPGSGYDVLVVERAWPMQYLAGMEPLPSRGQGDFFDPAAVYRFYGSRANAYSRTAVNLDADL